MDLGASKSVGLGLKRRGGLGSYESWHLIVSGEGAREEWIGVGEFRIDRCVRRVALFEYPMALSRLVICALILSSILGSVAQQNPPEFDFRKLSSWPGYARGSARDIQVSG